MRLFTPYKRRRRNQPNIDPAQNNAQVKQVKKTSDEEIVHDQGIVTKEETTWQSITDGIDGTSEYLDSSSQSKNLSQFAVFVLIETSDFLKTIYQYLSFLSFSNR